ncbi:MAG TPA: hypothetical protein VJN02_09840, partial [Gammaproteobacteria bacterium]|nr:hypothetical protein [Gammaproteobacteria bacterium]
MTGLMYLEKIKLSGSGSLNSENPRQRQYEALRSCYCDKLSSADAAKKFGFSKAYLDKLKHQFTRD